MSPFRPAVSSLVATRGASGHAPQHQQGKRSFPDRHHTAHTDTAHSVGEQHHFVFLLAIIFIHYPSLDDWSAASHCDRRDIERQTGTAGEVAAEGFAGFPAN